MAFKWTDRVDGQDAVLADDVNTLAAGIKENIDNLTAHKNAVIIDHPDGSITHEKLADGIIENNNISDGADSKSKLSEGLNKTIDILIDTVFPKVPANWAELQKIVRSGEAANVFSIGDQLVCNHSTYGAIVWDIIGIDHDIPADSTYSHSITLLTHNLLPALLTFDAPEATWYIDKATYPTGLDAGTYYFTLPSGYETSYGGGGTFNFTISNKVPVGGQIQFDWKYGTQASSSKIITYSSATATDPLETVSVASGQSGTGLPNIPQYTAGTNVNNMARMRFGSNNWKNSSLRQWMNTSARANEWWEPKTVFDRPANADIDGFLAGIDSDFLNVIGETTKTTQLSPMDGGGLTTSTEKFFILSRPEVYGGIERAADGSDGTVYEYFGDGYSDLREPGIDADTNRIKYVSSSPRYWWIRTPSASHGSNVRVVTSAGAISVLNSYDSRSAAIACCII